MGKLSRKRARKGSRTQVKKKAGGKWLVALASRPAWSYLGILALQLKVIWGMWWYKDLTGGDTSSYFSRAVGWTQEGKTSFWWSPLYIGFYSLGLRLTPDAYTVTIIHRIVILLLLAVLVLALMRRLLSPGTAWMMAAWWVVLPIDFNSLYEVHLFTLIPLLLAVLVTAWKPGAYGRGMSVALFLITGVLVRQEYMAAAALMAVIALGWDGAQTVKRRLKLRVLTAAYGLPLMGAVLVMWFFLAHNWVPTLSGLAEEARAKNSFNTCQLFAFDYQQRASDFQGNPWTNCRALMTRFFGSPEVTTLEATRRNPRVMAGHFLWNILEAPAGIQIALFNARWGGANPDYTPSFVSALVWIPTAMVIGLLAAGIFLARRSGGPRGELSEGQRWSWIGLLCVSAAAITTILLANARPATLLILAIAIRAATGFSLQMILKRWPRVVPWSVAVSVMAVGAVCVYPSLYERERSSRPLLQAYRRLEPARKMFAERGSTLVTAQFGGELKSFVGYGAGRALPLHEVEEEARAGHPFGEVLNRRGATLFLADEQAIGDRAVREFLADPGAYHWTVVSQKHTGSENWILLHRAQ